MAEPARHARPDRRRRVVAALLAGLTLVPVAGAALWWHQRHQWQAAHAPARTAARAGDPDIPAIDWPNGPPDDGRWTDDAWVTTVREYATAFAVAYNAGDLAGSADLRRLTTDEIITSFQEDVDTTRRVAADLEHVMYPDGSPFRPGPSTLTILDVQETDAGAVVSTCRTGRGIVIGPAADTLPVMSATRGSLVDWTVTLEPDGNLRITDIDIGQFCEVEDVHYGLFDPQPERVTRTEAPTDGAS